MRTIQQNRLEWKKEKNLIVTSTFYKEIQKTHIALKFPYNAECKLNPLYSYHTKSIVHLNLKGLLCIRQAHVHTHIRGTQVNSIKESYKQCPTEAIYLTLIIWSQVYSAAESERLAKHKINPLRHFTRIGRCLEILLQPQAPAIFS